MKYIFPILIVLFSACANQSADETKKNHQKIKESIEILGSTQGTTYAIVVNDPIEITKAEVDSIFANFDRALSGYIDSSIVTQLNQSAAGDFYYQDPYNYFNRCYQLAQEVYANTNGDFDPTVFPLVDGWGFMKNVDVVPDSARVQELRALLGFHQNKHFTFYTVTDSNGVSSSLNHINKKTPGAKLDFNAIAQGLSVDVIAEEIERRGGENYYVEIGGEIRVKGRNSDDVHWRIGIDKPIDHSNEETRVLQEVVQLQDVSIATSGNYRKFYEKNGVRYSHTLDPKTGYPVTHSLLSATVVAENCALADAMATAFMVKGTEKTKAFLKNRPELNLEVYLIYTDKDGAYKTYATPGFNELLD